MIIDLRMCMTSSSITMEIEHVLILEQFSSLFLFVIGSYLKSQTTRKILKVRPLFIK